jgi:hypothetical protein
MREFRTSWLRLAAAVAAAFPIGAAVMLAGTPGEQHRWSLEFHARLDQPAGAQPVEIDLSGDWVSTISAVRPGEYDAELEVVAARIAGAGVSAPSADAAEGFRKRMSRPFWATYRSDGTLLRISFFKDVEPGDRNLLQMIATETQFVRPDRSGTEWTVTERDGAGSYLALYDQSEPKLVVKRKLKYVHADGVGGAPKDGLQLTVDHSELRFSLNANGGILTLDATDRMQMGIPLGKTEHLTATVETHLANPRQSSAPGEIGSLARALPRVVSFPIETHRTDPAETRAQMDTRLLAGRSTESLLEAATTKTDDQGLTERLAALFRARPEAIPAALDLLRKGSPNKQLTTALASSRSPAALEGLSKLARDGKAPAPVREDALTALVRLQHPDAAAMRTPLVLLDDPDPRIASAARLVSGALSRAGRAENPEEADAIDATLIARYRKAQEVRDLTDLLAALGNSAGPSTIRVLEEALRDPREPLRAAAARSLRLAPGPEIDLLLAAAITSDVDPQVRLEAIFAAGFRRPLSSTIGEALVNAARSDVAEVVRSGAVTLLRRNPGASPRIAETLAWLAANDSNAGLRRLAREAIASVPAGASR